MTETPTPSRHRQACLFICKRIEAQQGITGTGDLARALDQANQSASTTLYRMHDGGWVRVVPNRGAFLTDAGRAVAEIMERRFAVLRERFGLDDGLETAGQWALCAAHLPDETLGE